MLKTTPELCSDGGTLKLPILGKRLITGGSIINLCYEHMKRHLAPFTILVVLLLMQRILADEQPNAPYKVRFGTLEINEEARRRYVFHFDEGEEVIDLSVNKLLSASGVKFPGLPDLREVGVKTVSGKILKYGNLAKSAFAERFLRDHPGEVVEGLVFEGLLDEKLVLKLKGKTPVCRVDITTNGDEKTLWKNLPTGTGLKDGEESNHDHKGK